MTLTTIGDENETLFDSIYSKFQKMPLPPRNSLSTGAKVHWGNNNEAMECCREINATATGDRPCTLATNQRVPLWDQQISILWKNSQLPGASNLKAKLFSKNKTRKPVGVKFFNATWRHLPRYCGICWAAFGQQVVCHIGGSARSRKMQGTAGHGTVFLKSWGTRAMWGFGGWQFSPSNLSTSNSYQCTYIYMIKYVYIYMYICINLYIV